MRIGELARRAGTTVRTLRYYDEIGLLRPSGRSAAGYRLYSRDDVERLASIRALRLLGLPLEQISDSLDQPGHSLGSRLLARLRSLDVEIDGLEQARGRLRGILAQFDSAADPSLELLTQTLKLIRMFEKYYTPEQLDSLRKRAEKVGEERMREVQQEWQDVFAGYREAMEKGLEPSHPEVQALAKKSRELVAEFSGGDAGIESSLGAMYRTEGAPKVLEGRGMDTDSKLWQYMADARKAAEP